MVAKAALLVVGVLLVVDAADISSDPFPSGTAGKWQWVPIGGSKCIDGRETGVYVKRAASSQSGQSSGGATNKLAIYHEGGGACFNRLTCATCTKTPKPGAPGLGGIFSSTDKRNPMKDFNFIWVPYCSGDVHVGQREVSFSGADRHFHGRGNLELMMARALATWPSESVSTLVITGESAGGFGSAANYDFYRQLYPSVKRSILLDDSGPILDDQAIPVCLQENWRQTWNLNASMPKDCPCLGNKGNIVAMWAYGQKKYPQDSLALISSLSDAVISSFFAFGLDNCKAAIPIGYHGLAAGLRRLATTGIKVYMIPGVTHTHTGASGEFYTRKVNDIFLYEWVSQLIADGPDPATVDPDKKEHQEPREGAAAIAAAAAAAAAQLA